MPAPLYSFREYFFQLFLECYSDQAPGWQKKTPGGAGSTGRNRISNLSSLASDRKVGC